MFTENLVFFKCWYVSDIYKRGALKKYIIISHINCTKKLKKINVMIVIKDLYYISIYKQFIIIIVVPIEYILFYHGLMAK